MNKKEQVYLTNKKMLLKKTLSLIQTMKIGLIGLIIIGITNFVWGLGYILNFLKTSTIENANNIIGFNFIIISLLVFLIFSIGRFAYKAHKNAYEVYKIILELLDEKEDNNSEDPI